MQVSTLKVWVYRVHAIINCYQLHENNYFHLIITISLTDVLVGQVIIKTKNIREGVHNSNIIN